MFREISVVFVGLQPAGRLDKAVLTAVPAASTGLSGAAGVPR
ncbi:hypothetical protein ARZXY2_1864 [Arthrobacter sp. ZXY-2]|nr:hypothetical protein ARZXY2_1864 [Arthrobacter sp. ZXY-2]